MSYDRTMLNVAPEAGEAPSAIFVQRLNDSQNELADSFGSSFKGKVLSVVSGMTLGNGSMSARAHRLSGRELVTLQINVGTTTNITGSVTISGVVGSANFASYVIVGGSLSAIVVNTGATAPRLAAATVDPFTGNITIVGLSNTPLDTYTFNANSYILVRGQIRQPNASTTLNA